MPDPTVRNFTVSEAEAGQKLLSCLKRRLGQELPASLLHRIIRSGEVRVNGKRCKPFDRLEAGDEIRLPPIREGYRQREGSAPSLWTPSAPGAKPLDPDGESVGCRKQPAPRGEPVENSAFRQAVLEPPPGRRSGSYPILNVVDETLDYLIINKPAGLPSQPGSGHSDSLSSRLAAAFPEADFTPTPAHRLDKNTSGLILAAKSYRALRAAQDAFREHTILKDYLAWAQGSWPEEKPLELYDLLEKRDFDGLEKMTPGAGKEALCRVQALARRPGRTLLLIRLFTGRTHQIRVQLSSRGHPIIGDVKYGGPRAKEGMFLHAWRLSLPDGETFSVPPPWRGDFAAAAEILTPEK